MRGSDAASGALFSYVDMEARVLATHPLRTIRTIVNEVLDALDTEFEALYEGTGRQSVAPERLLTPAAASTCTERTSGCRFTYKLTAFNIEGGNHRSIDPNFGM